MHRQPDFTASRIAPAIDLAAPGKRAGAFHLRHSDNSNPLGVHPIPAMAIVGAPGPTLLLIGGVHGDEYEGPVALHRLYRALDPAGIVGRLIILPTLNAPAVRAAARVSPLDGGNLNRAFPGDRDGPPTAAIAHLLEACLIPVVDAVIDLHSGGKASWFAASALAARTASGALDPANMALAEAFRAPLIWVLGAQNDDRSVNGAATRAGVPAIAAELGGGGALTPGILALTERGLRNCLAHLGMSPGDPAPSAARRVELARPDQSVTADHPGLYQPCVAVGADVAAGDLLGLIHPLDQPDDPPREVRAPSDGVILAETRRGLVAIGDFLALVASDVAD